MLRVAVLEASQLWEVDVCILASNPHYRFFSWFFPRAARQNLEWKLGFEAICIQYGSHNASNYQYRYLLKSSLHTMQGILSESYLLRGGATYKPPTISTGINVHDNMSCCLYTTCEQTSGADRSRIRRNPRCQPNHRLYIDHVKDTHSNLPPVNSSATYF